MFLDILSVNRNIDELNRSDNCITPMRSGEKALHYALITVKTIGSAVVLGLASVGLGVLIGTVTNKANQNKE